MTPQEFFLAIYGIGMDVSQNTNGGVWEFISKVEDLIKRWKESNDTTTN